MLYKNIIWLALLFTTLTGFVLHKQTNHLNVTRKWLISESSSLCVNGSTNINKFACEVPAYDQTDTLTIVKDKIDNGVVLSGKISLKIESFDCHNPVMTHDLRKTLKMDQFPLLHISFLSLNKLPELGIQPQPITGLVEIEIAGVRKQFVVNYQISVDAQKVIHLIGSRDVNFSDFNLIPPRKLGGLIKTNDKLSVDFHLKMKNIDR